MQPERTCTKPQWFLFRETNDGWEIYQRTNCRTWKDAAIIALLRWGRLSEKEQNNTKSYIMVYSVPYGKKKIEPDWSKASKFIDLFREIKFFEKHGPLTEDEVMGRKEIL